MYSFDHLQCISYTYLWASFDFKWVFCKLQVVLLLNTFLLFLLLWAGEFKGRIESWQSCIFIIFFINRTVFVSAKCML